MDKKKKIISLTVFSVGLATLVAGVVFLVLILSRGAGTADGDFLVSKEKWVLENEEKVVWDFTEIGKGTLTTNSHENDYNFKWAIEDDKLKIETDWLYDLENEYEYELDQGAGKLTLHDDDGDYTFIATESQEQ